MKARLALLAVVTVIVLGTASTLEIMNWCAPTSDMPHHFKTAHR